MLLWRQLPWVRHAIGLPSRPGSQAPPAGVAKKANHRHDTLCASVWAPMAKAASGLTWRYSTNCVNPRLSSERLEIYTTTMCTCKEVRTQFGIPPLTFARKHGSPGAVHWVALQPLPCGLHAGEACPFCAILCHRQSARRFLHTGAAGPECYTGKPRSSTVGNRGPSPGDKSVLVFCGRSRQQEMQSCMGLYFGRYTPNWVKFVGSSSSNGIPCRRLQVG